MRGGGESAILGGTFTSFTGPLPVEVTLRGEEARRLVCEKVARGIYPLEDVACLCGAQDDRLVATVDRYRTPHSTVLCRRCGLVRTNPRWTAEAYVDFYTHHYRDLYERADHSPDLYYAAQLERGRERADFILRRCRSTRISPAVLEIGCGGGWNLQPFQQRGWTAVGWDFDDDYLAAGRERGLDLRYGSLDAAVARNERFELIILSHVLEHLLDPRSDLRKLRNLLTPQGALYIEVPSLFDVSANLLRYFQNAHTYSFVPKTLESLMESAGYHRLVMDSRIRSLWLPHQSPNEIRRISPSDAKRTEAFLRARDRESRLYQRYRGLQLRMERWWLKRPGQVVHVLE
jgi:SAM-dependent methyltransferase